MKNPQKMVGIVARGQKTLELLNQILLLYLFIRNLNMCLKQLNLTINFLSFHLVHLRHLRVRRTAFIQRIK